MINRKIFCKSGWGLHTSGLGAVETKTKTVTHVGPTTQRCLLPRKIWTRPTNNLLSSDTMILVSTT